MLLGIDASQANREQRSGTEWYAFYLIRQFAALLRDRREIKVRLYLRGKARADLAAALPDNFEIKSLRWPIRYFWAQGRLSLEMAFNAPDILFSPAHTIPLVHPKNTFTALHDIGFDDCPELYDRFSLWYHRFSARFAVRRAKHIFTVSDFSRKRVIEKYRLGPEKISTVYPGYDRNKYRPYNPNEIGPVLKKYGLSRKNYFLFVGRLEPKKNIQNIIKAYDLFESLRGRPGSAEAIPGLILVGRIVKKPQTNNPKVRFLGYIEESDKPALYAGAAAFVFPTLYEGFGLPIIEAQACGAPVITSGSASNPEVAGSGALIVNPNRVSDIAAALQEVLSDETKKTDLIKRGLENVKRFDWRETAERILDKMLAC